MALRTIEHWGFAYNSYVKNSESVSAIHRNFQRHFNVHCNNAVTTRNTILCWVNAPRTRGILLNMKPVKAPRRIRTPENVERV